MRSFILKVVTEGFNKTVLAEIAGNIDPNEKGKTLIFAVDDAHADMITRILKEHYSEQGVSEKAVMKITGSPPNGNPVKTKEAIRLFKNEDFPNIVVTVDGRTFKIYKIFIDFSEIFAYNIGEQENCSI